MRKPCLRAAHGQSETPPAKVKAKQLEHENIGVILEIYRDNGKENGSYYIGDVVTHRGQRGLI